MPNIIAFGNESGGGGGMTSTLLWTNPSSSTNQNFNAQAINIPGLNQYNFILFLYNCAGDNSKYPWTEIESLITPYTNYLNFSSVFINYINQEVFIASRSVIMFSSSVDFGDCYQYQIGASGNLGTVYNRSCVPYQIYGIN